MNGKLNVKVQFVGKQEDIKQAINIMNEFLGDSHPCPKLDWDDNGNGEYTLETEDYHSSNYYKMFDTVSKKVSELVFEAEAYERTDYDNCEVSVSYDGNGLVGGDTGYYEIVYWEFQDSYDTFVRKNPMLKKYSKKQLNEFMQMGTIVETAEGAYRIVFDF